MLIVVDRSPKHELVGILLALSPSCSSLMAGDGEAVCGGNVFIYVTEKNKSSVAHLEASPMCLSSCVTTHEWVHQCCFCTCVSHVGGSSPPPSVSVSVDVCPHVESLQAKCSHWLFDAFCCFYTYLTLYICCDLLLFKNVMNRYFFGESLFIFWFWLPNNALTEVQVTDVRIITIIQEQKVVFIAMNLKKENSWQLASTSPLLSSLSIDRNDLAVASYVP